MVIYFPLYTPFCYILLFFISNSCLHFITEEDGQLAKHVYVLDYGIMALAL